MNYAPFPRIINDKESAIKQKVRMRVSTRTPIVKRVQLLAIALTVVATGVVFAAYLIERGPDAGASPTQLGVNRVTLNPGGGILSDGTDGIRFTVNAQPGSDGYESAQAGQDALLYRGTFQYCCSAGGPMLNIGGTLYGQSGPAYSAANWSSIEIIATSGVAAIGARTSETGNSSVIMRYTVVDGGLTYSFDRTITYTYPNDYVTDDYDFTIPEGNTDVVKFYLGGDTAPGSSDQGYGIMLTEPVRSVISLNTSSEIMFGFREVAGSRPFDGATSQPFYTPYSIVQAGGDIGFVGTASNHDAGLMMQWNLGSTPGEYTGKFQQFATKQGTNLNAAFAEARVETGQQSDLNISIVNSELGAITGLGYTLTLPAGLLINDTVTTDCSGSLTATVGTGTITMSGVSISGASNCVVTVPVSSSTPGSYTINAASVSGLEGVLTNNVGASTLNIGVYAVVFVTQGGTSVSDIIAEEGDLVSLPVSTRTGHSLTGWNTAVDGSGTSYVPAGELIIPSEDLTLYAIWQAIPYDLTYDTQGGSSVAAEEGILYNQQVTLPLPTRAGYALREWNTAANGSGTSYEAGDTYFMAAADTTLYALWDELYTLTFDTQGGSAEGSAEAVANASLGLPAAPTREGYRFMGWNTAANGNGDNYSANGAFTMPSGDTTLYATWSRLYNLSIVIMGVEDEEGPQADISGAAIMLPSAYEREGYTFIGWNTAANGSGVTYEPGSFFIMPAADSTLYAIWEDNDGLSIEDENAASANGDANGDSTPDSQQSNVSSFISPKTNRPVSLEVQLETEGDAAACTLENVSILDQSTLTPDEYEYPGGLLDFTVDCGEPGFTATIKQYFYDLPGDTFVLRKFMNGVYTTISDATFVKTTINGEMVWVVTYTVVDGGPLDADGVANGIVVDPAGPGVLIPDESIGAPNTGLQSQGIGQYLIAALAGLIVVALSFVLTHKRAYDSKTTL